MKSKNIKGDLIRGTSLICGIIATVIWISTRILSGSPYELLHKLNGYELFPPVWLYSLLCMIWSFILGVSAGIVINILACSGVGLQTERNGYKGGLVFLLCFFLYISYYPLMFAKGSLFIASISAIASAICSAVCAFYWLKVSGTASLITGSFTLWQIYIFIITFSAFLSR